MIVRRYAQIFGISFLLVWLLGLRSTADAFGVLNSDHAEDTLHLLTGLLLTVTGFFQGDRALDLAVVGQGIFYLLIGTYAFANPDVLGLFPHGLGAVDNIIHLGEGALSIILVGLFGPAYGRLVRRPREAPA
jgi:hypothetical protein